MNINIVKYADKISLEKAKRNKARIQIEEIAPLWKQVNIGNRYTELIELRFDRDLTVPEKQELLELKEVISRIQDIRNQSNL